MSPLTALVLSSTIFVVLFVVTILNFARMGKNMMSFDQSFEDTAKGFGNGFALHVLLGGAASLAFLTTIGCAIWLAVVKLS